MTRFILLILFVSLLGLFGNESFLLISVRYDEDIPVVVVGRCGVGVVDGWTLEGGSTIEYGSERTNKRSDGGRRS